MGKIWKVKALKNKFMTVSRMCVTRVFKRVSFGDIDLKIWNKQVINPLGAGIFFQILAHPVFKMWIIQEPKKVALWNKRHFKEEKMESVQHV
jgi:hypothetical protein